MNKYDKMIACNRKASAEKIDLARRTIFEMVEEGEKVTDPQADRQDGTVEGVLLPRIRWYGKRWTKRWSSRSG